MLSALFMKPGEKDALAKMAEMFAPLLSKAGSVSDPGEVLDALRSKEPATGFLSDVIRFLRHATNRPELLDAGVTFIKGFAEKKGIDPTSLAGVIRKIAPIAKIDVQGAETTDDVLKAVISNLASREIASDTRIGAACVCPECNFTFFV